MKRGLKGTAAFARLEHCFTEHLLTAAALYLVASITREQQKLILW